MEIMRKKDFLNYKSLLAVIIRRIEKIYSEKTAKISSELMKAFIFQEIELIEGRKTKRFHT